MTSGRRVSANNFFMVVAMPTLRRSWFSRQVPPSGRDSTYSTLGTPATVCAGTLLAEQPGQRPDQRLDGGPVHLVGPAEPSRFVRVDVLMNKPRR